MPFGCATAFKAFINDFRSAICLSPPAASDTNTNMGSSHSHIYDPHMRPISSIEKPSPFYSLGCGRVSSATLASQRSGPSSSKAHLVHEKAHYHANSDDHSRPLVDQQPRPGVYLSTNSLVPDEATVAYEHFLHEYPGMPSLWLLHFASLTRMLQSIG